VATAAAGAVVSMVSRGRTAAQAVLADSVGQVVGVATPQRLFCAFKRQHSTRLSSPPRVAQLGNPQNVLNLQPVMPVASPSGALLVSVVLVAPVP
jgi:hypothetical protein